MKSIVLKGITWGHSRGITPLLALAQRYNERHPHIEITWEKRTLQAFADYPIEALTHQYDLLIIDHPWVGRAESISSVLPLNKYLTESYLQDQALHSVGVSHQSYNYKGSQWALAIDAAAPVASYRRDLLPEPPQTWEAVINLAKAGKVAVPAIPIDMLMNFYTFCLAHGKEPFQSRTEVVDKATGIKAIETMMELYSKVDRCMFDYNPIAVAEKMSATDDYWYCPFAYGYSNYARNGYAARLLHYGPVVSFQNTPLRTTLGGTGIAVSAFSRHKTIALDFAAIAASGECQRSFYVQHGGQPGHRSAWTDADANHLTHNYFTNTLNMLDNAYLRPRYNGYLYFQDHAGLPLQQCLMQEKDPAAALETMNSYYFESQTKFEAPLTT